MVDLTSFTALVGLFRKSGVRRILRSTRIEFEPRDLWIGLYHTRRRMLVAGSKQRDDLHLYICLVPVFPLHLVVEGEEEPHRYN